MTTRLFFLVPDEPAAEAVTEALRAGNIPDQHIHAVARRDRYPLKKDIPEANVLESSDVVNAAKRGAAAGGATGLFAGLVAVAVLPAGMIAAGGAVLGLTAAGTAVGSWASSLIGISVTNTDFKKEFEDAIDEGKILMLVDTDDELASTVESIIKRTHPEAVIRGGQLKE